MFIQKKYNILIQANLKNEAYELLQKKNINNFVQSISQNDFNITYFAYKGFILV